MKFDAGQVLDTIERRGITNVWLAPSMVNALLAHPTLDRRDLSGLRLVIDGGEKMPLPLIERLLRAFPVGRIHRDALVYVIGEGTAEIQRNIIARALGLHP